MSSLEYVIFAIRDELKDDGADGADVTGDGLTILQKLQARAATSDGVESIQEILQELSVELPKHVNAKNSYLIDLLEHLKTDSAVKLLQAVNNYQIKHAKSKSKVSEAIYYLYSNHFANTLNWCKSGKSDTYQNKWLLDLLDKEILKLTCIVVQQYAYSYYAGLNILSMVLKNLIKQTDKPEDDLAITINNQLKIYDREIETIVLDDSLRYSKPTAKPA